MGEDIGKKFLAQVIKEDYESLVENCAFKNKNLKQKDFEDIADKILDYDNFWEMLYEFIDGELVLYE